ncbi:MAG TPA: glycosyltransferase family 39 protein [Acidobacteriaceae bacterium]|nr:glycosyltransferase family 39 protein [Acidobacteriaceae bacterium]
MRQHTASSPKTPSFSYPLLALFLLLSAALSLIWSHMRLMWNDEFLSFYSDGVATFKQVILVQLHHPISLDPPTYHLLSHLSMDLIGRNAIALRLPALAGFLLFQLCLFFFVRRLAGDRSAIIAMAAPLLTASFRYSVEGRPYGLLLGLYALSLLCWQIATLDDPPTDPVPRSRILPLTGLTLSIALAITSHYFGVLILIPVSLGELSRTYIRKRLDFGVLTALILGLASVGIILPFQRALMVYRQHYYIKGVNIHDISQGYRELFIRYTTWPIPLQKLAAAIMVVLALTLVYAGYKRFKRRPAPEHAYTWVALLSMALLPFFGYLFGRFVTHTMEVRYVIAALIAFAATFGIVLERKLRSNAFYYAALTVIFIAAIAINVRHIYQERRDSAAILASFQLSPEAAAALHQNPHELIYLQSLNDFYLDTYYDPDPTLRPRFSLLYGQPQEIYWLEHDTNFVTAVNMLTFAPLSITSYADFLQQPHPLLLLNHSGWEWIDKQLDADHTPPTPIARGLRGNLVRITNPPLTARH